MVGKGRRKGEKGNKSERRRGEIGELIERMGSINIKDGEKTEKKIRKEERRKDGKGNRSERER